MTSASTSPSADPTASDVAAVRSLLGPADPVPDPTLAMEEVLAARASVGLRRASTSPGPPLPGPRGRPGSRGRFVAAGAVAVLSVATLVALVVMPTRQDGGTVTLATGPGARAVSTAYATTAGSGTARGLLTVTDGIHTVTATGVGDFESGAARAEISLVEGDRGPATEITVIRSADAIYAKVPGSIKPMATGKPWVSVDAATLAGMTQMGLGDLAAQATGAPLDALAYLKAISGDVQVVGPDTVRDEATTHYRGTVDPAKVAEQLPAAARPDADRAAGQLGTTLPADLWIDGRGRLRKLVLTAEASKVSGGGPGSAGGTTTITLELFDFGTPVDATPPPADQVVDVGGLLGGFLGGTRTP